MESYKSLRIVGIDSPTDINEIVELAKSTLKKKSIEHTVNVELKKVTFPKMLETDCFSFEFVLRKLMDSKQCKEYMIDISDTDTNSPQRRPAT